MKKLSYLFIIVGVAFVSYALIELYNTHAQTNQSLEEAQQYIDAGSNPATQLDDDRFIPDQGASVGLLSIPKLNAELPIIEGTDPNDLAKGVGHYKGSYYPEENGQIVLSGHRDTVFRQIGELDLGDTFEVELPYGTYTYEMVETEIVPADDESVITLQDQEEELIVTTCYPFSYIGDAPDRYIMYAKRIDESK
ncbi:class D sortase [Pontibacillus litoralis]|uniref:Sortase n=1 Tax=Pontibacillus litoralis JSM 072002 TaxID=1385512 RepID=A0A0A5G362_9BACI|nr:class D sortase [Pontibacillus litoralis]KGX85568.1 hypothetical protein N784_08650 [Pontibacillus litoralis JSM 072002]